MRAPCTVATAFIACALLADCGDVPDDDYAWISSLRLIAAKSEPAEATPGESVTITTVAADADATPIVIQWADCLAPPVPGTGTVNPQCVTEGQGPLLVPLGAGPTLTFMVPGLDAATLGPSDITGGIFLPVRMTLENAAETITAIARLRISLAANPSPNHNPTLESIQSPANGARLPLADTTVVHAGDTLPLYAHFSADSSETYVAGDDHPMPRSEVLRVSWFATAGHFSNSSTDADAETDLDLTRHPPPAGATVELWAVGRDDRGGLDYQHRSLQVR